jgi:hypothetical protein
LKNGSSWPHTPYITPLLPHITPGREFYILSVNTKHLQLGRWRADECNEVILPRAIPPSLREAGAFDQPDHDLEGRSAAGSSTGQMHGVHFGTSSEREKFHRIYMTIFTWWIGNSPAI